MPYEHPSTVRITTRIAEIVNSLSDLLVVEADILSFCDKHACLQFLNQAHLQQCAVASAIVHLPHLQDRATFFTGKDGHYHFGATAADAALRLVLNSPTAVAGKLSSAHPASSKTFPANFLDSLNQLVVKATFPCVACAFVLEQPVAPSIQLLEKVFFWPFFGWGLFVSQVSQCSCFIPYTGLGPYSSSSFRWAC
jgi:hypothetical protein